LRNVLYLMGVLIAAAPCQGAEVYPNRPVRIIVHLVPGGTSDLVARLIARQLDEQLKQPFIVENRPGASGTIAGGIVARAQPDGHTLLAATGAMTIYPGFGKPMPYEVARDFTPVTQIAGSPNVLVVQPSLNVSTVRDFVALAQAQPGKFNYGSNGFGGTVHMASELFKMVTRTSIVHIPYKGGGDLITAMLGGHIQMAFGAIPTLSANIKSGQLRALAVTTDGKRSPALPDVPSMSEAGISGMAVYSWYGLAGPAKMPREVVARLHAEVLRAIALPALRDRLIAADADPVGSSPAEFAAHIRAELKRWATVIKTAGIVAE
jgi:tripartite-type tricarboxylate transporter receptor subunit TctC